MRPASEIISSLEMVEREYARQTNEAAVANLSIVRDVLRWVAGMHWVDLVDSPNPWLIAILLDDPPKLDDTPPETN